MANGLLFVSSSFFLLVLLVSSSLLALHFPSLSTSENNLFLSLNLHKKVFPGRNSGPRRSSSISALPPYLKLKAGLFLSEVGISALLLVILSGDVSMNPGPVSPLYGDKTCSSSDDESTLTDTSSVISEELNDSFTSEPDSQDIQGHFNLGLGNKGLRFGTWNVNGLTLSKFDQIRLFILSSDNRPQIDILSINESHLKPSTSDSLYEVPGFDIHRSDRKGSMKKGGVLVYVNKKIKHKRRTDLEDSRIEAVWLEVYPYKSNRPLLFAGVYRRPAYLKEDDELLEKNIESAYLLNLETIISGDTNVNYLTFQVFRKHRLIRALTSMHFKQLVTQVTRPISKTCLDHIFSNRPERIHFVGVRISGLADHLPVFAVRFYKKKDCTRARAKPRTINYRNMKGFDKSQLLATLKVIPWDTVFMFDEMDDMLGTCEQLFNKALDRHCPWRKKNEYQLTMHA